jgi:hypothetical protein
MDESADTARVHHENCDTARVHREVLEQIAAMPDVQRNPDGEDQAAATMKLLAREALDLTSESEQGPMVPKLSGEGDASPPDQDAAQGRSDAPASTDRQPWGKSCTCEWGENFDGDSYIHARDPECLDHADLTPCGECGLIRNHLGTCSQSAMHSPDHPFHGEA